MCSNTQDAKLCTKFFEKNNLGDVARRVVNLQGVVVEIFYHENHLLYERRN